MEFSGVNIQELQLSHSVDVNASTGSLSAQVDIPLPQGRAGFSPALSLHYSSSGRNSVFGLGWSLNGLPFIGVDTTKGLPKYDGSDNFAFNGANRLVPVLLKAGVAWQPRVDQNSNFHIYYYRPENEFAFIRFEKWVSKASGEIHWRTRTKNDTVSVYGAASGGLTRIFDPENPHKVFLWLLEAQYDGHGNAIHYHYKAESGEDVNSLVSYETGRLRKFNATGYAQRYPDRIIYGNTRPMQPDTPTPTGNKWLFEVALDYGEYSARPFTDSQSAAGTTRAARPDPFSAYNAGFEIRTYRLCKRIFIWHHFDELSTPTSLTGIFECTYDEHEVGTTLQSMTYTGVRRDLTTGNYSEKSLPALRFNYSQPQIGNSFRGIVQETNENLPQGLNHVGTRMADLLGEGLPGILTETSTGWYYKPNVGNGTFGRQKIVINKPSQSTGTFALGDFDQDGNINLFSLQGRMAGYYEYNREKEKWSGFNALQNIPRTGVSKLIDVDADGFPDLVVEQEDKITCYPFKGKEGFGKPYEFSKPRTNGVAYAPTIGEDHSLDYFLTDMTGDGLPDQVRIQNGRVEYFPNLGNGHFGQSVVMENAPVIDFETSFDAGRIRLYDLEGTGTADVIYLGNGELRYWYNAAGNKFVEGGTITGLPYIDNISTANILDFLGNGTPCLVWSNTLSHLQYSTLQYLELTDGIKPRLLKSVENSMGKEIRIEYGYSARHYLEAQKNGTPWISGIPSHFTVVDKKVVIDHITNTTFTARYSYKDGYYDGGERTFVTFGLTEQYDTEQYAAAAPGTGNEAARTSCLKSWFHSGLFGWNAQKTARFYQKDAAQSLLTAQRFEQNEALESNDFENGYRSLAGRMIRQELFPVTPNGVAAEHPFEVTQNAYCIRKLQPKAGSHDSCFFAYQSEVVSSNYEEQSDDPRITHHLTLAVNAYGDVEKEVSLSYARRSGVANRHPDQCKDLITAAVRSFVPVDQPGRYLAGLSYESKGFEINHIDHPPDSFLLWSDVLPLFEALIAGALPFDQPLPVGGVSRARLVSWNRTLFWNDAFDDVLPPGQTGAPAFVHHEEAACFNDNTISNAFGGKVITAMLSAGHEGNYLQREGYWWQRMPVNHYKDINAFFSLDREEREAGNITQHKYDPYHLSIVEVIDALGNVSKSEIDYNRIEPFRVTDPNDNVTEVLFDALGVAIASFQSGSVLDESGTLQKYGSSGIAGYSPRADESFVNILANPQTYVQQADRFLYYDLNSWRDENKPLRSLVIARENLIHNGIGAVDNTLSSQLAIAYQDGFGRTLQSKQKVESGSAIKRKADGTLDMDAAGEPVVENSAERWLVSGHVVYNNKQEPVRQFEPFFSPLAAFENDVVLETLGVSSQNYYDAVGRLYRTDFPNNTFSEVRFSPWEVISYDENDTVDRSFYKEVRELLPNDDPEKMALDRSLAHKETPTIVKLDPLGREIVTIRTNNDGSVRKVDQSFDINGHIVKTTDARDLPAFEYQWDMLGRLLYEKSLDAGEKWSFPNNLDHTIHLWDSKNSHQRMEYDRLDRAVSIKVDDPTGFNQVTEKFIYGEDPGLTQTQERNLRGQLVKHYDQGGTREVLRFTPQGLPLRMERKLCDQVSGEPDWTNPAAVALGADTFVSKYTYDALGRTIRQDLPDQTTRRYIFKKSGAVDKVLVSTADGRMLDVELLKGTFYDANGMRLEALLGNEVSLNYTYDEATFRMTRLFARGRNGTPRTYQDLRYTYDPVGNLVYCLDHAQQSAPTMPHLISGLNVSTHSTFEYDALYQLKTATGRVHQALLANDYADRSRENGLPPDWAKGTRHISLNNGAAIERYTRHYSYDVSGNIQSIQHNGASRNWTRQLWVSPTSNRSLPLNDMNGAAISNPESRFDSNGNCLFMPHLRNITWNYRNNIAKAVVIDRSAQGKPNDEELYVYGGDGMRLRKITQRLVDVANDVVELTEKIYLDGCEVKRISRGGNEILKRFTSHITDGTNNIALIHAWEKDTLARETADVTQKKIHYQLSNHLGSASLELDENGEVINYEEYFPYGGTSFIAGRNRRDIDLKSYRYSGKERDDFTGLYYFGYRYYAHWIGGWMNPDPLGPEDSENLYLYVQNNPINLTDPNGLSSTVRIRMLSSTASLPEELQESASATGNVFFVEGIDERYNYTFGEIVEIAREQGKEIQVYDREATARFFRFMEDSSDANYQAYLGLMYDIEEGLEAQHADSDFLIQWHEMRSDEPPAPSDESDDSETTADDPNASGAGQNNEEPGEGNTPGRSGRSRRRDESNSQRTNNGTRNGSTRGNSHRNRPGSRNGSRDGRQGGDPNGSNGGQPGGQVGGQVGGSPDGNVSGQPGGEGSENVPGTPGGTSVDSGNGSPDGATGNQGGGNDGQPGERPPGEGQVDWGSPAGGNPDITDEEPSWWQRGLLAMAGAVFSIANIFVEAGKQLVDLVGLSTQCLGIATGWYEYDHEVVSGIGLAAQSGQSTGDIFRNMGQGIIETPSRAWAAAERGDWFGFGSESMNLYMLGRSAAGAPRAVASIGRTSLAVGRSGVRLAASGLRNMRGAAASLLRRSQKNVSVNSSSSGLSGAVNKGQGTVGVSVDGKTINVPVERVNCGYCSVASQSSVGGNSTAIARITGTLEGPSNVPNLLRNMGMYDAASTRLGLLPHEALQYMRSFPRGTKFVLRHDFSPSAVMTHAISATRTLFGIRIRDFQAGFFSRQRFSGIDATATSVDVFPTYIPK